MLFASSGMMFVSFSIMFSPLLGVLGVRFLSIVGRIFFGFRFYSFSCVSHALSLFRFASLHAHVFLGERKTKGLCLARGERCRIGILQDNKPF